ncbi:ImmA/IrrE family metallo-endopeptidase [Tenacibaculum soleae]|uniref:ImmA/IrrE family metallo-endopeptidase n=1 Tax=Tenacibaculum soleae TaxID=447689 RepID=UPI0026E417C9|nr:ImmA/IrrE family metallo-endopeptidase [Tenacibaculum soleae]MDO6813236.1 ImmA/IrrE family metallo-endopeptidase [Tenacibaculum soleae]
MTKWSHIKSLAEFIALQYDIKTTPLEKIIEDEGLNVFYDNYGKNTFDGMTFFDAGCFYIHINLDMGNKKDSDRGRFTLAHEMGHYFIDAHRIGLKNGLLEPHQSKTNKSQFNKIERQADYFASCLLMPEERYAKDIFKKKFNFELIEYLRTQYKVSRTACAFRYSDIGHHPLMIVFAKNNRIKWKHYSDDFPYKHLINDDIVPEETIMGEYFKNIKIEIFKSDKVWAIDCFKFVRNEDLQKTFYEHCITYKCSALSIFWED